MGELSGGAEMRKESPKQSELPSQPVLDLGDHETPQMYNESPFVCELHPVTFYFLQPQDLIKAGWKPADST